MAAPFTRLVPSATGIFIGLSIHWSTFLRSANRFVQYVWR